MKITTKVTGAQQARANAAELSDKIARGAMRIGITKAARIMAAKARSLAPVGATGLLKKSIRQKVVTKAKKQSVSGFIGPSNKVSGQVDRFGNGNIETVRPVKYAHLVEFGTGSRGVYGQKGKTVTPGNAPQPFMRPAFEATKNEALTIYKKEVAEGIPKVAAQIRKRKLKS